VTFRMNKRAPGHMRLDIFLHYIGGSTVLGGVRYMVPQSMSPCYILFAFGQTPRIAWL
jgi:hypothetical protein